MKNKITCLLLSIIIPILSVVFPISAQNSVGDLTSVGISDYNVTVKGKINDSFIDNTITIMMKSESGDVIHASSFGCMTNGDFRYEIPLSSDTKSGIYNISMGKYGSDKKIYDCDIKFTAPSEEPADNILFGWNNISKIGIVSPDSCGFYIYTKNPAEGDVIEYILDGGEKNTVNVSGRFTYVAIPQITNGEHTIDVKVLNSGTVKLSHSESFVVMRQYTHQYMDEFSVRGAVTHYPHFTAKDIDAEFMEFAGIKTIRDGYKWNVIETQKTGKGNFDWAFTDSWIKSMNDHDIRLLAVLGQNNYRLYTMYHHHTGEKVDNSVYIPRKQKDIEYYNAYVEKALERYPDVDEFELWNEPNADTGLAAVDYTDLLMNTMVAVKRKHRFADMSALSLFGFREVEWTQENFTSGMYPYMTAIAFHPYVQGTPDNGAQEKKFEEIYQLIADNGGWKNMNITENGWSTYANGVDEYEQAVYLAKQFVLSEQYDLVGNHWYDLVDDGTDTKEKEHFFGIISNDRKAKPAFLSYTQLNTKLAGTIYMGEIALGKSRAFVYEKDNEPIMVIWTPGASAVHQFDSDIKVEDLYGNDVHTVLNSVIVGDSPVYISGLNKAWFEKAVTAEIKKEADEWNEKYAELFTNATVSKVNDVFSRDLLSLDDDELSALLGEYKDAGLAIIGEARDVTDMTASGSLYALYRAMRMVDRLFIVRYDGGVVNTLEADVDAAVKHSEDLYFNDFYIKQYSEELLRYAYNYQKDAKTVLQTSENNPVKNGVIKGWDIMSDIMLDWFYEFSSFEKKFSYGMLMNIYLDNDTFIDTAEENTDKSTIIYLTNKTNADFTGKMSVHDSTGKTLCTSENVTVSKGSFEHVSLTYPVEATKKSESRIYTFRVTDSDGNIISERNHEIMVYSDSPESGYPDHTGKGNYGADNFPRNSDLTAKSKEDSDENYVFDIDGKRFVVLDKDEDGNYFVAADDEYGIKGFNLNSQTDENVENLRSTGLWKYDPAVENNIAYWLNNDFLKKGNTVSNVTYKLPDAIISNLVEKSWTVEYAKDAGVDTSYDVISKVALMSATEWNHYADKLGYAPYNATYKNPDENGVNTYLDENGMRINNGWWLRTPYNQSAAEYLTYGSFITVYRYATHPGLVETWSVRSASQRRYVRPVFWLKSDFFEKNEINIDSAGDEVVDELLSSDLGSIKEIYGEDKLVSFGKTGADLNEDRTKLYVMSPESRNMDVIYAGYDKNGKLVGADILNVNVQKGIKEYDILLPEKADREKILLWESIETMKPITGNNN